MKAPYRYLTIPTALRAVPALGENMELLEIQQCASSSSCIPCEKLQPTDGLPGVWMSSTCNDNFPNSYKATRVSISLQSQARVENNLLICGIDVFGRKFNSLRLNFYNVLVNVCAEQICFAKDPFGLAIHSSAYFAEVYLITSYIKCGTRDLHLDILSKS